MGTAQRHNAHAMSCERAVPLSPSLPPLCCAFVPARCPCSLCCLSSSAQWYRVRSHCASRRENRTAGSSNTKDTRRRHMHTTHQPGNTHTHLTQRAFRPSRAETRTKRTNEHRYRHSRSKVQRSLGYSSFRAIRCCCAPIPAQLAPLQTVTTPHNITFE